MKKIMATLLAMVLVLAMCVPAMAATLTVNNAYPTTGFAAYKMLDLEVGKDGSDNNAYKYSVTTEWAGFLSTYLQDNEPASGDIVPVNVGDPAELKYLVIGNMADFAKAAVTYAVNNNIAVTKTAEAGTNRQAAFTEIANGFYLILTLKDDGSVNTAKTPLAISVNESAEIVEKNAYPQISKQLKVGDALVASNTASIGDLVTFQIAVGVSAAGDNYVIHDAMDDGFTFEEITSVTLEGEAFIGYQKVDKTCNNANCDFEIKLTKPEDGWEEGAELVVTYTARLNKTAEIAGDGNKNTAWLTFDDHNGGGELPPSTSTTYTYEFDLVKTDGENKLLDGAQFELTDAVGNDVDLIAIEGGYRLADESEEGGNTIVVTGGKVTISGLANGVYTLTETVAPQGYNMLLKPETFKIEDGNLSATIADDVYSKGGVQVINQTGSALPETGGIGTTVFYVVGGLLMAAAVVLLVAKKKVSGNK